MVMRHASQADSRQDEASLYVGANLRRRTVEQGRFRLLILSVLGSLCYGALMVKLVETSVAERSLYEVASATIHEIGVTSEETLESVRRISRNEPVSAPDWQPPGPGMVEQRRAIHDRNGVLLASSAPTRSLYAHPHDVANPEAVVHILAKHIPDLNRRVLLRRLSSDAKFVWLKRHLTPEEQEALLWSGIPGVHLHDDYRRIYPHGHLFSHVLGYTDVDGKGIAGVEQSFNDRLSNTHADESLRLSMDIRLQRSMRNALVDAMGHFQAVAATGAIFHIPTAQARAMVSLPDYDPNHPMASPGDARFNRLSVGQYELGSLFKVLSTAMALEHGNLNIRDGFDTSEPIRFKANTIRDYHGKKRWLSVPEILTYSSNIGTVKMVKAAGMEHQREFLRGLGMFSRVGIELEERVVPTTPDHWRPIKQATISYGHGIAVTPLHLIQAMLAVNSGGVYRDMTLLDGTTKPGRRLISEDTARQVNQMMRAVVKYGTAKLANVPGYAVGGKTGTANKVKAGHYEADKKRSSLVAAFPMPKPEYLIFVMLDEPKGTKETFNYATGGWVAAPVVGRVVREMGHLLGIPPHYRQPPNEVDRLILEAAAKNDEKVTQDDYIRQTTY